MCTNNVQSKPSSDFALRHWLPQLAYKTCAHKRRGSYPISEPLWETYAADNVKAKIPLRVWKMFGFYVTKSCEMQKLHMSFKQICTCLTDAVDTKCENSCVFAKMKPQSILTTALE